MPLMPLCEGVRAAIDNVRQNTMVCKHAQQHLVKETYSILYIWNNMPYITGPENRSEPVYPVAKTGALSNRNELLCGSAGNA